MTVARWVHMFGANLKALRKWRSVSQQRLGEYLGVSAMSVSKWEKGANEPDLAKLARIADFFGVTMDLLVRGTPHENLRFISSREQAEAPLADAAEASQQPEQPSWTGSAEDSRRPEQPGLADEADVSQRSDRPGWADAAGTFHRPKQPGRSGVLDASQRPEQPGLADEADVSQRSDWPGWADEAEPSDEAALAAEEPLSAGDAEEPLTVFDLLRTEDAQGARGASAWPAHPGAEADSDEISRDEISRDEISPDSCPPPAPGRDALDASGRDASRRNMDGWHDFNRAYLARGMSAAPNGPTPGGFPRGARWQDSGAEPGSAPSAGEEAAAAQTWAGTNGLKPAVDFTEKKTNESAQKSRYSFPKPQYGREEGTFDPNPGGMHAPHKPLAVMTRAYSRLTPEQQEKMLEIGRVLFASAFDEEE